MRILILESSPTEAESLSQALERGGIPHIARRVAERKSFTEALTAFGPDLILANYELPGFGGLEALEFSAGQSPDVPMILLAGALKEGTAVEALRRGAADFILRDNLSELVPSVLRALRAAEERKQRRRTEVLLEVKYQQLQLQNEALQQSEERFRQLAESVREVFWMTNPDKTEMLYISPAYEEIWGRTCASLYTSPLDWLKSIHPEDRDRVKAAALHKQAAGDYNEEYRIMRPDGSVRWIHDRASPVRDESGAVYRIAGLAEDVTARKLMEKHILEISDREQERIGRDLHDGLCQLLVSIGFKANILKQDLEEKYGADAGAAEAIGLKITDAIKLARHLAHGLCPVSIQYEDLATALGQLAHNTTEDFGIQCAAECPAAKSVSDPSAAMHVYRIAQEAAHNAVKHGKPSKILIRLAESAGRIILSITDDGVGFVPGAKPSPGMGLQIMQYRASMLGGTLEVRAPGSSGSPGRGTIVSCAFPRPVVR